MVSRARVAGGRRHGSAAGSSASVCCAIRRPAQPRPAGLVLAATGNVARSPVVGAVPGVAPLRLVAGGAKAVIVDIPAGRHGGGWSASNQRLLRETGAILGTAFGACADFGATGGRTADSTDAIQRCVAAARPTVRAPSLTCRAATTATTRTWWLTTRTPKSEAHYLLCQGTRRERGHVTVGIPKPRPPRPSPGGRQLRGGESGSVAATWPSRAGGSGPGGTEGAPAEGWQAEAAAPLDDFREPGATHLATYLGPQAIRSGEINPIPIKLAVHRSSDQPLTFSSAGQHSVPRLCPGRSWPPDGCGSCR